MIKLLLSFLLFITLCNCSRTYAILLSTSRGYYESYSFQSGVALAYRVLREKGVDADDIVTMMYNDISSYNKYEELAIYGESEGENLYEDLVVNYSYDNVTINNFIQVLNGSHFPSHGDRLFIYMTGEGIKNGLVFWNGEVMDQHILFNAINESISKYSEVFIVADSDFSGSLFYGYNMDDKIYVITSSKPDQPSRQCNPSFLHRVFLSQCFSVTLFEHMRNPCNFDQSLYQLFRYTKLKTTTSDVRQYGSKMTSKISIMNFFGLDDIYNVMSYIEHSCDDNIDL
jgi:glycosylphosphatidylinositol transamidase (GPIT) subunit GPI8